jgi:Tfp pilus assembly protein PilO
MKMDSAGRMVVAILVVVVAIVAFWLLLLGPKRKEADELSTKVEGLQATLAQTQSEVAEGERARREFAHNYRQLVVLGKAVPANDETSSLLIQVNHVADSAGVTFQSIELGTTSGSTSSETETTTGSGFSSPPVAATPTEAEASLLPLGATIGPAGLNVMPYNLTFTGSFFHVADFIKGIDSLVGTSRRTVAVDGRLVTLDGFALEESTNGFPQLNANFAVTTYLVPPGQGLTAGATAAGPAESAEATESGAEEATSEAQETAAGTPSASVEGAR